MRRPESKKKPGGAGPEKPTTTIDWQQQAEACLAGWQRTQADFDNYRKRMEAAQQDLRAIATADLALKVAPLLDDFRRALAGLPDADTNSPWATGMRQIEKRLRQTLADEGWSPIEDGAQTGFDPNRHEAIAAAYDPNIPEGNIIDLVELGWRFGDKVMKPARVRVSKGKPPPDQKL